MLDKLERKFGKYAIHNFSYYILVICIIGAMIGLINPSIYYDYLSLDFSQIFKGQIWRLITFIFYPYITSLSIWNIFCAIVSLYLYYYIGNILESTWGAFRFNIYYLSGLILNILATLFIYLIFKQPISFGMTYIQNAMFLAFATIVPDMTILVFFILPIKIKWLGYIYGGFLIIEIISGFISLTPSGIAMSIAIIIAMCNFIVYFISSKKRPYNNYSKVKRKNKEKSNKQVTIDIPAHKCCVCGRTNITNPELEFRYCSKCNGEYEYCSDHLFNHEHISKK